ncbi:MAG: hypothetical protein SVE93_04210 [Candidatus Thermoplasmatota archaeon]|nr:hypothetical protein [Candidatus Thermoplasmatota archaeon]
MFLMSVLGDLTWWCANHLPLIKHCFYWFYYNSPEWLFEPVYECWRLLTFFFRII